MSIHVILPPFVNNLSLTASTDSKFSHWSRLQIRSILDREASPHSVSNTVPDHFDNLLVHYMAPLFSSIHVEGPIVVMTITNNRMQLAGDYAQL